MTAAAFRKWAWVHKWSSLVCTLFVLMLCITGLPLVFVHEIIEATTPGRDATEAIPFDAPRVDVDRLLATSRSRFPGHLITNVFVDDDEPHAFVSMVPSFQAVEDNPRLRHWLKFDMRTGEVINTSEQFSIDVKSRGTLSATTSSLVGVMVRLHVDLFAGLPGQLFLGLMGILFVVAIVSGIVLYGPFMRKIEFGAVRTSRSPRLKWLDLHNLLGIVLVAWTTVVGLTGALNELAVPLNSIWRSSIQSQLGASARSITPPDQSQMVSLQEVLESVRRVMPDMVVQSITYPAPKGISDNHFIVAAKGDTPLTSLLFKFALVDVRTGELTTVLEMPWYLRTLQLSRPLHFGNYGGMPLKIIWALLDVVTIVVLGSGLYLWWSRRSSTSDRIEATLVETNVDVAGLPRREAAE